MKQQPPDSRKSNLQQKIGLVKWEQTNKKKNFNLLTVHSLIVDDNPKFIELKCLIDNYNKTPFEMLDRQNLRTAFIAKLYQMLCELIRIPIMENQISFLDKIYIWADSNKTVLQNAAELLEFENLDTNIPHEGKTRPATASTRTRPFSAYSRPISGVSRGINSKKATIQQLQEQQMMLQLDKQFKGVDYQKLQLGERQFYDGRRTRHPIYEHPKKRLKQYRRKVYYDEIDKSGPQEFEEQQQKLKDMQVYDMKRYESKQQELVQQLNEGLQQPKQGQQGFGLGGEDDINVEDIPLDVEEQMPEQETQQPDKLKPVVKVFQDYRPSQHHNKKDYHHGQQTATINQKYRQRQIDQDTEIAYHMTKWGSTKAASKTEINRRAESARMLTQKLGFNRNTSQKPSNIPQSVNVFSLEKGNFFEVKSKAVRSRTAFNANSKKVIKQTIKDAFITGHLSNHVKLSEQGKIQKLRPISVYAAAPKKKTFQEILRQAQQKVKKDADQQIQTIKQTLVKNKVSINANRISKSISSRQPQLPGGDDFVGLIAGFGMYSNPFFKVAKKKTKKKKKK